MGHEKLFCFDDEFFDRRRPAPFCQQTNLVKFSSPKLKLVLQLPAKNFKEIVKIKCDNHKILDNFRQIKNYSEECPRHHTEHFGVLRHHPSYWKSSQQRFLWPSWRIWGWQKNVMNSYLGKDLTFVFLRTFAYELSNFSHKHTRATVSQVHVLGGNEEAELLSVTE